MKKIIVQTIIHMAAWACFLLLPFVFYPRIKDYPFTADKYRFTLFIVNTAFIILFYYLNTLSLIPKLLEHKRFWQYSLIILALLIFYSCLPRIYHHLFAGIMPPNPPPGFRPPPYGKPHGFQQPLLSPGNFAVFMLVFVFSTGIRVVNQWLHSEQRNKEIASEKVQAELSFLKAQINPHFLFNTLNNIYSLASVQSEQTAPAVLKLSSIMRYVLTEARHDLVPLEKEIQFTTHFIELQKMRLTSKTPISFTVEGNPTGKQIAPLLLLPFIENAFKYGVSTREVSPITILLETKKDSLYFSVSNHKHLHSTLKLAENTGIGIENARRRLDLLYKDQYELRIGDEAGVFTVHLNIYT